jgi:hypothetical protein
LSLTYSEALVEQRNLAKLANFVDNFVRVPFTKVGVGADAAVGVAPGVGDLAGIAIFSYVFVKARRLGLPASRITLLIGYALLDALIGLVPGLGDFADIFTRPSRRALHLVSQHLSETHGISQTVHVEKPFLHEYLDNRRASAFWSNGVVRWITLHLPDFIGLALLIVFIHAIIQAGITLFQLGLASWNYLTSIF